MGAVPAAAAVCVLDDKVLFMNGSFENFVEGDAGQSAKFATFDPETGAFEALEGALPEGLDGLTAKAASSGACAYYYAAGMADDDSDDGEPDAATLAAQRRSRTKLLRYTYDAGKGALSMEDITEAFWSVKPAFGESVGSDQGSHFALAGVTDGLAIVGSETAGADTYLIRNGTTQAVAYGRTSCYHTAFNPVAAFGEGQLFAMGCNATEPDAMYFRSTSYACEKHSWDAGTSYDAACMTCGRTVFTCSACGATKTQVTSSELHHSWGSWQQADGETHYRVCANDETHRQSAAHSWDAGVVTRKPAIGVAGERTYECSECLYKKIEEIAALPGGATGKTYKVAGNTYKVTSNKANTVTLAKGKKAAWVTVPATVKINKKAYKVTAIAAKAFAGAKARLARVAVGANVKTIGASAFKGCKALVQVKLGSRVATIGASAFRGCKALSSFAVTAKVKKIGAAAFAGCTKLKVLTVKSKLLAKSRVKGALKGSKVNVVKVKVGTAKLNKKYAKKYAKAFAKKNCGKKVSVK